MLAGRPLTLKCITELVESFSTGKSNIPHGKIPQNMLFSDTRKDQERYVWYNPPQKRMMFFSRNLNIEDREYHLPGIIYDTGSEHLDVYAFKEETPDLESKLYKPRCSMLPVKKSVLAMRKLIFRTIPHSTIISCTGKRNSG
jgi:hypothetical protein